METVCHRQTFRGKTSCRWQVSHCCKTTYAVELKNLQVHRLFFLPEFPMAKCDEGYICHVCGKDVESISQSDLYLRYVLGKVDPEVLHTTPERHIRCNPVLAQFIKDDRFEPVQIEGAMSRLHLDPGYVSEKEALVSRGYRRLWELKSAEGESILDFPLEEFRKT